MKRATLLAILCSALLVVAPGCGDDDDGGGEDAGEDGGTGFCEQAFHLEFEDMGFESAFDFEPEQIECTRFEAVHVGDETHVEICFEGSASGMDHFELAFELYYLEVVEPPEEFDDEIHDGLITAGDFDGEIRGAMVYQTSGGQISGEFDGELFDSGDPVYACFQSLSLPD